MADEEAFDEFVDEIEGGLRRALVAAFGLEVGREAAADALVWAWQHWPRVQTMVNPGGYLFRVGQSAARRQLRRESRHVPALYRIDEAAEVVEYEPALERLLSELSPRQRAAVLLVHGYGLSLAETARLMGCSVSSVRNHTARALGRLQDALGGSDE